MHDFYTVGYVSRGHSTPVEVFLMKSIKDNSVIISFLSIDNSFDKIFLRFPRVNLEASQLQQKI